jgi:hypothetical protein
MFIKKFVRVNQLTLTLTSKAHLIMYRILALFLIIALCHPLYGQNLSANKYSALSISDSLKKDAHAVYRLDEGILEITSPSRYTSKIHQIITILDESGAQHLRHSYGLDKFNTVEDLEVKVYNSAGTEVKRYKKKDFQVQSAFDGISLVTDNKVMYLTTMPPGYPCTVEINAVLKSESYIELPDWYLNTSNISTEVFRYVVKVPATMDIRYRAKNIKLQPVVQNIEGNKVYTWELRNIPNHKLDEDGFEAKHYMPSIEIAPNIFEYDGHRGEFKDWRSFGTFVYNLFEESDPFDAKRKEEIRSLVKEAKSETEKVDILYSYLQKNMRYVSIQLGIGGLKPFPVHFVDEKKYGDCKALTNYMRYMLSVVGIKSYPALINSGYDAVPADPSFPSDPFNHVILCVPLANDSLWLECTSNRSKTGFLGSFTENKNALLMTEKGGVLVLTPRSKSRNNQLHTKTDIYLKEDGSAEATSRIYCTGDERDIFNYLRQVEADRKKELLVKAMNYKLPDVFELTFSGDSLMGSAFRLKTGYFTFFDFNAGNKLFFRQGINRLCGEELKDNKRTIEYLFDHPYEKVDTTVYYLPKDFVVQSLLPAKELVNDQAYYKVTMQYDSVQHNVTIVSHLILKNNLIPAAAYSKAVEFFKAVRRNEEQMLIFKKL